MYCDGMMKLENITAQMKITFWVQENNKGIEDQSEFKSGACSSHW
jgi:hypothetical protein